MTHLPTIFRLPPLIAVVMLTAFAGIQGVAEASAVPLSTQTSWAACGSRAHDGSVAERLNQGQKAAHAPDLDSGLQSGNEEDSPPDAFVLAGLAVEFSWHLPGAVSRVGRTTCSARSLVSCGLPRGPPSAIFR